MRGSPWAKSTLGLGLLLLARFVLAAVLIEVTPDRNPVRLDETFNLVFSANAQPDEEPDFRPLEKDFEILGQNQSSQVSIVNGSFTKKSEWILNVMARRAGSLTIPAISFGSDSSRPGTLEVQASGASSGSDKGREDELFLELDASPKNPYVQAQTILTVKLFRRINFTSGDLSEPNVPNALLERLGEDRQYTAEQGGKRYGVIERKYALFPQQSGHLRIEPLTMEARIPGGRGSPFNNFFNPSSRIARIRSEPLELDVRPIPAQFSGQHWLPAEHLELEESWSKSPPQTLVGEPITRTLNLRATGSTVGVLPELAPAGSDADPAALKQYRDQPVLNEDKQAAGMNSVRQEKIAYLANQPGSHRLPAIEVPWWNTKTDRMETARLPARDLLIGPSGSTATRTAPVPGPSPLPVEAPHEPPRPLSAPASGGTIFSDIWFWIALISALGWLGTGLAWWRRRSPASKPKTEVLHAAAVQEKHCYGRLREACRANDARRARQALAEWASFRHPESGLAALRERARREGGALAEALSELDRSLYGPALADWNGEGLWKALETLDADRQPSRPQPGLEPLYRSG